MANLDEALGWLNVFDVSHLREAIRERLDHLKSGKRSSQEITEEINKLGEESKQNPDRWEYPEVLLIGALIQYRNRHLNAARGFLRDAHRAYEGNVHRQAVTQWMLGYVEWELMENDSATTHWEAVRERFSSMAEWYHALSLKSNFDTKVTRASLFEEAFGWLNQFEPSHLTRTPRELQAIIEKRLSEIDFMNEDAQNTWVIYQLMYKLIDETRVSTDFMETAEAYVECGAAAYWMGHVGEAMRYLEMGINQYHPGTHQQAVAKWLLGIVQWDLEGYDDLARRNWQEAIETFEGSALNAQHRNRTDEANWYRENLRIMYDALGDKIRSTFG